MTEDKGMNITDNVIMGDINQSFTTSDSKDRECRSCGTTGIPIFRCQISSCEIHFCSVCFPNCSLHLVKRSLSGYELDKGLKEIPYSGDYPERYSWTHEGKIKGEIVIDGPVWKITNWSQMSPHKKGPYCSNHLEERLEWYNGESKRRRGYEKEEKIREKLIKDIESLSLTIDADRELIANTVPKVWGYKHTISIILGIIGVVACLSYLGGSAILEDWGSRNCCLGIIGLILLVAPGLKPDGLARVRVMKFETLTKRLNDLLEEE